MPLALQPHDDRSYFILPQSPEDAGYYVYGTPGSGAAQYAHPRLMNLIFLVEQEWCQLSTRKFGIGNISIANGLYFGHKSHMKGLEVDIRPIRIDGKHLPIRYTDPQYDREATSSLIGLFQSMSCGKISIFFNDLKIPGVAPLQNHDDHFHFQFNSAQIR